MSKEHELLKNDYLWDGSGEPDPAVLRLEKALGKFRHAGHAPELPGIPAARASEITLRGAQPWFSFAAVAASILLVFSVWAGLRLRSQPVASGVAWGIERVEGSPRLGSATIAKQGAGSFSAG